MSYDSSLKITFFAVSSVYDWGKDELDAFRLVRGSCGSMELSGYDKLVI